MSQLNAINRNELVEELSQAVSLANEQLRLVLKSDASAEESINALVEYPLHLDALAEAGDSLELSVLSVVVRFVASNARYMQSDLPALKSNTELCDLFLSWESSLISCLAARPGDDEIGALLILLQQPVWPVAIDEDAVMGVAETLLSQASQADGDASDEPTQTEHDDTLGIDIHDPGSQVLDFASDLNPDLKEAFMAEVPERASCLTDIVVSLAQGVHGKQASPADQVDALNEAQRHAHTIKGSANITGVYGLANITHVLEDILEHFVNIGGGVDDATATVLVDACDLVSMEIDHLSGVGDPPQNLVNQVETLLVHRRSLRVSDDDLDPGAGDALIDTASNDDANEDGKNNADSTQIAQTNSAAATTSRSGVSHSESSKSSARVSIAIDDMDRVLTDAGEVSIATVQLATYRDSLKQELKQVLVQQNLTHEKLSDLENQLLAINNIRFFRVRT